MQTFNLELSVSCSVWKWPRVYQKPQWYAGCFLSGVQCCSEEGGDKGGGAEGVTWSRPNRCSRFPQRVLENFTFLSLISFINKIIASLNFIKFESCLKIKLAGIEMVVTLIIIFIIIMIICWIVKNSSMDLIQQSWFWVSTMYKKEKYKNYSNLN